MRQLSPLVSLYRKVVRRLRLQGLDTASRYWDIRYESGGNSGAGSFGKLATFKAEFLNRFVADHGIRSVLEFGCGDGNQLSLYDFPGYVGLDVSPTAIALCRNRFRHDRTKRFERFRSKPGFCRDRGLHAQLTISIDVIFHLTDNDVYDIYLKELFSASDDYVIVYASNCDDPSPAPHVRHRRFVDDVARMVPAWELISVERNPHAFNGDLSAGSFSDFHVFKLRRPGRAR
jgi:SAM-dependent methyltransferase